MVAGKHNSCGKLKHEANMKTWCSRANRSENNCARNGIVVSGAARAIRAYKANCSSRSGTSSNSLVCWIQKRWDTGTEALSVEFKHTWNRNMKVFSIIGILECRISSSYVRKNKGNQCAARKHNRKRFSCE